MVDIRFLWALCSLFLFGTGALLIAINDLAGFWDKYLIAVIALELLSGLLYAGLVIFRKGHLTKFVVGFQFLCCLASIGLVLYWLDGLFFAGSFGSPSNTWTDLLVAFVDLFIVSLLLRVWVTTLYVKS